MRYVGKLGLVAGLFSLMLAIAGTAAFVGYAVAQPPTDKDNVEKPADGRGLISATLGFEPTEAAASPGGVPASYWYDVPLTGLGPGVT